MSSGIANANPSVSHTLGSDATGTGSPAESFTEFLENEEREKTEGRANRQERRAATRERQREAPGDGADDNGEGRDPEPRQPKRERSKAESEDDPLHDPVLDGDPPESDEEGEDGDDEDGDDADPDDAEDDGADGDDEGDEDPEHDVTVNGVVSKVKLSELVAGYSREADYRQKTTALSEERAEFETFAGQTAERAQRYDQGIKIYQDLIAAVMPSQEEWDALEQSNPTAFIAAQKQWGDFLTKVETSKADRERIAAEKAEFDTQENNKYIRRENSELLRKVPQLSDPKARKAFTDTVLGYTSKMGYTKEEVAAGLINHRDVMTAYYAGRYLQIMESRKANQKSAKAKAPRASEGNSNPRPVQTAKGRQQARRGQELRNADRDLARTGTQQSAAKAFSALFAD